MARNRALLIPAPTAGGAGPRATSWPSFHADVRPGDGESLMRRDRDRLVALEHSPELGPSLFLYRWARPTISLGYAQRAESVLDESRVHAAGWPVVRRPTGGRAILHVDEWTWSAVVPLEDVRLGGPLRASLLVLTAMVVAALRAVGVEATAARRSGRHESGGTLTDGELACFAFSAGHEILADGRKLCGSAQRRLVRAALTQGTILVGPGHERLADVLRGDEASRRESRKRLLEETVTLAAVSGRPPAFEAFAGALERSWRRGGGTGFDS